MHSTPNRRAAQTTTAQTNRDRHTISMRQAKCPQFEEMDTLLTHYSFRWLLDEALQYARKARNLVAPGRLERRSRAALICWYCQYRSDLLMGATFFLAIADYSFRRLRAVSTTEPRWPVLETATDGLQFHPSMEIEMNKKLSEASFYTGKSVRASRIPALNMVEGDF
jgi:hypothetical protein